MSSEAFEVLNLLARDSLCPNASTLSAMSIARYFKNINWWTNRFTEFTNQTELDPPTQRRWACEKERVIDLVLQLPKHEWDEIAEFAGMAGPLMSELDTLRVFHEQ